MLIVPKNKALERWDTLPMVLREALYSEENSDFLWKICEAQNVPKEKIYDAARVSGYVLMGFLRPEEVANELQQALGVDQKTASNIADALNKQVFSPLRKQIDQVYAPVPKSEVGPKMMQEVKAPAVPIATPKPPTPVVPAPQIISQTYTAAPNLGTTSLASNKNVAAPAPQPPKPSNDAGWSRRAPQGPTVKLGAIAPQVPVPPPSSAASQPTASGKPAPSTSPTAPSSTPLQTPPPVSPQSIRSVSEFDRLDAANRFAGSSMSPIPSAAPAPKPTASANVPASGPAPMILHQQPSMPTQNTPDFKVAAPVKDQMIGTPSIAAAPSSKPAMLEFGIDPSKPAPKALHYTEYQPPAPPRPAQSNVPRQVTEITAPQAVPVPIPPAPPMPPSPQNGGSAQPTQSKQPAMPQSKVIVKDFL